MKKNNFCKHILKNIPDSSKQLFLPLYLKHPAALEIKSRGVDFCGISEVNKGFEIRRIPNFHTVLFTVKGQGIFKTNKTTNKLTPGSLLLAPIALEHHYFQDGDADWRFIWFHLKPPEQWNYINIDQPILGRYKDLKFIENAINGFASEISVCKMSNSKTIGPPTIFYIDSPSLEKSMVKFEISIPSSRLSSNELAMAHAKILLTYLERELKELLNCQMNNDDKQLKFDSLWEKVNSNLDNNWTLATMASCVNMTIPTFIRYVRKIYNSTPINILYQIRLRKAERLIVDSSMPIFQIAEVVGYNSLSSFSASFKKAFEETPREYRQNYRNDQYQLDEMKIKHALIAHY